MKAKDIMTTNVVTVAPDATILEAIRIMLQRKISGLPVVDKTGKVVGMVTEGDFLRRAETGTEKRRPRWLEFLLGTGRLATDYVRSHGRKVEEIMTLDPVTASEDTPLDEIVKLMEKRQIKRVPIMRGQKLVGIISRANLLHALATAATDVKAPAAGDTDIREKIMAELKKEVWAPVALIDVTVRNGVVDLWGTITDERQRGALVVVAENVPGVKQVRDHLAWVDTTTGTAFYLPEEAGEQKAAS